MGVFRDRTGTPSDELESKREWWSHTKLILIAVVSFGALVIASITLNKCNVHEKLECYGSGAITQMDQSSVFYGVPLLLILILWIIKKIKRIEHGRRPI